MRDNLENRGDVAHSLLHIPCSSVSEACLVADELRGRVSSVRKLGRLRAVLVRPLAASLASLSTFSLPSVLLCPLTQPISNLIACPFPDGVRLPDNLINKVLRGLGAVQREGAQNGLIV